MRCLKECRTWYTRSEEETRILGLRLGESLVGGEVIALTGQLGTGKTVLASGILLGAGARGPFRSPTFTLVWEHQGRIPIHHVDLYRLVPGDAVDDLPWDQILSPDSAVVIEWADRLPRGFLPRDHVRMHLQRPAVGSGKTNHRRIEGRGCGLGAGLICGLPGGERTCEC